MLLIKVILFSYEGLDIHYRTRCDTSDNVCRDLHKCRHSFNMYRQLYIYIYLPGCYTIRGWIIISDSQGKYFMNKLSMLWYPQLMIYVYISLMYKSVIYCNLHLCHCSINLFT